jgi:Zn-dependent protease
MKLKGQLTTFLPFTIRFILVHTVTYAICGIFFMLISGYFEYFKSDKILDMVMKPENSLSVQLAIFNVIPFPALDGGWIFLLLFEIITRKKIDDNKIGVINYIGFAILMALMVVVVIKDIFYPIKL